MGSLFPGLVALRQVNLDDSLVEVQVQLQPQQDPLQAWLTPEAPIFPTSAYICPDCVTEEWVTVEEEEAICRKCGYSFGYEVTSSAEYRWFGTEDRSPDPSRVGNPMNPLLPESSLGTRIVARPGESRAMQKIRQYHLWNVMPYRERTLWNVFEGLQVRAANAGISAAILDETKQLYAQVSPLCICRGQQKEALMAACLFESLKRHDTPRRPAEIAEIFKIDMKLITRGVKQFAGLLDEHLHAAARKAVDDEKDVTLQTLTEEKDVVPKAPVILQPVATPSTNFRHYLEPAILRLETPRSMLGTMEDQAIHFGNLLDELGICPETTPPSLAACSIALATQHLGFPKTNQEIALVCGISLATLQKCMKRIEPWKPTLFKPMEDCRKPK
jgi:transcription initiation factor TFIIIB Brf1 subunit/transcription initiation factor TFIIB